ncbi:MmpS family protein [Tsukamurella ocularis]|uniref:MmpS family protein n=1 Tax=Tsukamurella ocularis TaxID=1970234 RepID=UPI002168F22E|nr:MmpS family protein [Tsukamurella ocularis]
MTRHGVTSGTSHTNRRKPGWRWITITVVVVMVTSGTYVGRLRLSEIPDRAIGHSSPAPEAGVPRQKSIEYVVSGPAGTSARVSYLGSAGRAQDELVRLPWRKVVTSHEFTATAGVLAQTSGSNSVSCAVRVNGVERASERGRGSEGTAAVNCAVPVA